MISFKTYLQEESDKKVKKVRPGWFTITVYDFEDIIDKKQDQELHFDAYESGKGKFKQWLISWRDDIKLMDTEKVAGAIFYQICSFDKSKNAKAYLLALKDAFLKKKDLPHPEKFEEFAYLSYGFEKDNRWNTLLNRYK